MAYWIFQGNPDVFEIDKYIETMDEILWSVRQRNLASEMSLGDQVFIWRASGSTKRPSGIVALTEITDTPREMPDDEASHSLWISGDPTTAELRVRLRVLKRCLGAKEIVKSDWMKIDPALSDLRILRMRTGTNYAVTPRQGRRLTDLVMNTGRNWSRDECLAALWAYANTYGGSVSKRADGDVAIVALAIGRAVDGVYNKIMNFRSVDPRDKRAGLSSINQLDRVVWDEFYDPDTQSLDKLRLGAEFGHLWGGRERTSQPSRPRYQDFGEAPDDDPNELRKFAAKVRKGQPRFRKKLLQLYDGRCAITGDGPEAVLEAAHIVNHAISGINKADNGLLLRADIHSLFDAGWLRIDPDTLEVRLNQALENTSYWTWNGRRVRDRTDGKRPSADRLRERWETTDDTD